MTYIVERENQKVSYADTPNIDAFGRLRVSQLTTQFDAKQLHDKLPLFIDEELIGASTSTHNSNNAETELEVTSNLDAVIMQTKQRFNYQSGKSQLLFWTFHGFDNEVDTTKRVGYFSSNTTTPFNSDLDGIFLQSDGTNLSVQVYRTGTNISSVNRSSWLDPLDGTGESGITHDFNDNTILAIDFEWLGVGRIRFGVVKDGQIIPFHTLDYTGTTLVYMSTPNQPFRWEVRATGATGGTGFSYICSSVNSEGSINQIGKDGGIGDDGSHLDANNVNNWYYAIGLRLSSTKLDTLVDVLSAQLKSDTNDDFEYRICMNPTYAGTVTYNSVTNYSVEYGLGATANTVSAFGSILNAGYGVAASATSADLKSALKLGANIDGTADEIVVIVKPHSSNLDVHRAINWRELS